MKYISIILFLFLVLFNNPIKTRIPMISRNIILDCVEKNEIGIPEISYAGYCDKDTVYGAYSVVSVAWSTVSSAESYQIKIIKTDGTSKVYNTKYIVFTEYGENDDFIVDGMKEATVKIRALGKNGNCSIWSKEVTLENNLFLF